MRKLVAQEIGFRPKDMATQYENEDGASFNDSFHHALQHLLKEKMVIKSDRTLSVAALIRDKAGTVHIPQMPDYVVGSSNPPQLGRLSWPVDIPRLEAELPGYSIKQLLLIYHAAEKRFVSLEGKEKSLGKQIKAFQVQGLVCQEFVHRGLITYDHELGEFRWPTTEASGGDGALVLKELPAIGPLKALGYEVGKGALGPAQRHRLLTKAFLEDLPQIQGVEDWGDNDSSRRLQKMAESIAASARNAKRRKSASWTDAIVRWENDLEYLRIAHYIGRFDSSWAFPSTTV